MLHTFGLTSSCEGVHLRDGQDQAPAVDIIDVVDVVDVVDVLLFAKEYICEMGKTKPRLKDYEEELHKHRMTKSQLSTEKVRGLNLQNNLSMGVILK